MKISVELREAPQKLRDHLLVNTQQFESYCNKMKGIIETYLNTNKTWIASDFRESDPMDVDHISKRKSKSKGKRQNQEQRQEQGQQRRQEPRQRQMQEQEKAKAKARKSPTTTKNATCAGKKFHLARDCWSRANNHKMVNEVEAENANAEPGKEFVFTIENVISDVTLSQDGCDERENGLVMIDSGASVNVCPKWCGKSKMEQSDGTTCLGGANGKPLQEYGKRQIWLKIFGQTKRYDFHVVNVTKLILSVSCLCEHGVETHLAKKSFLRFGDGHEPLIRKGGVYYVKAHTVNAVESETHDKP